MSALTVGALAAIYETACFPRVGRGGVLEGVETALRRGLMDIALCWVMSDAGLRRSEAAALTWDDIARWDNGSGRLTVRRSKTDATPAHGLSDAGCDGASGRDTAGGCGRV